MINALDILIQQHQLDRNLLTIIDSPGEEYQLFRREIILHVNMEEAVFYPNLLKDPKLELHVKEAWEEHSLSMGLLQELDNRDLSLTDWRAKFNTLKKIHLSHLEDEEQILFPRIREDASPEFLIEVGEQMLIEKMNAVPDEVLYPTKPKFSPFSEA